MLKGFPRNVLSVLSLRYNVPLRSCKTELVRTLFLALSSSLSFLVFLSTSSSGKNSNKIYNHLDYKYSRFFFSKSLFARPKAPTAWIAACESRELRTLRRKNNNNNNNRVSLQSHSPFLHSLQTFRLNTARVQRSIAKIRAALQSKVHHEFMI